MDFQLPLAPDVCGTAHPSAVPQLEGGGDASLLDEATLAVKAAHQPIY